MKYPLTTILLLLSILTATAQQADSLKFNNRKFKQEIGIDVKDVFGGFRSSALIWKIRNDRGKLIAVSYAKNWRFQLYTSSTVNTNKTVKQLVINSATYTFNDNAYNQFIIHPLAGFERINFFNRFNLYYGADFGIRYEYQNIVNNYSGYFVNPNGVVSYFTFNSTSHEIGPTATAFVGMKYRFAERFSISLESAFGLSFLFQNTTVYDNISQDSLLKESYQRFSHSFAPLRFITFNYHFKQY